jgi:putative inorganic carbon (HCO3(-)) transporter
MSTRSLRFPIPDPFTGGMMPLILGFLAAALAALFVLAPWGIGIICAIAILVLSAIECTPFLLGVIFLIPVGWSAKISFPLGGGDARLDFATTARLIVVLGFFMGRMLRGQLDFKKLWKEPLTLGTFAVAGVAFASVILGGYGLTYGSVRALVRLLSYIGFYLFLVLWVNSRQRLRTVAFMILSSTILVAVFGIIQEIVGDYTTLWLYLNPPTELFLLMEHRVPSFLNYSNSLAGYLNLVLPFALAGCFLGKETWKKLSAWTLGLGAVTLACTQSVGGLVAFGFMIVAAAYVFVKSRSKRVLLLVGMLVFALGFYAARETLNPAHIGESVGYDAATRFLLWDTAWNLFVHSPIIGVGWGNFTEIYGSYLSSYSWIPPGVFEVHNIYLQFLAETGLVGFTVFFLFIFHAWRRGLRQLRIAPDVFDKALAFGVLGAIITMLVHGFVDFLFQVSNQFGTLFWALLALLIVSARLQGEVTGGSLGVSSTRG